MRRAEGLRGGAPRECAESTPRGSKTRDAPSSDGGNGDDVRRVFHNASSGDVKKFFLRESGSPRYHHSALAFFALCALVWRGEKLLSFGDFARGFSSAPPRAFPPFARGVSPALVAPSPEPFLAPPPRVFPGASPPVIVPLSFPPPPPGALKNPSAHAPASSTPAAFSTAFIAFFRVAASPARITAATTFAPWPPTHAPTSRDAAPSHSALAKDGAPSHEHAPPGISRTMRRSALVAR